MSKPKLFSACVSYNLEEVKACISSSDVDQIYESHNCITYMIIKLTHDHFDDCFQIIDLLIKQGADVHHSSIHGNALSIAMNMGYRYTHYVSDSKSNLYITLFEKILSYGLDLQGDFIEMDHLAHIWYSDINLWIVQKFGNSLYISDRFLCNNAGRQNFLDTLALLDYRITAKMVNQKPQLLREMLQGGNYEHIKYLFDDGYQLPNQEILKHTFFFETNGIECRSLEVILTHWDKVSNIGLQNLLHISVSASRKDIIKLLISYGVSYKNSIYRAMQTNTEMYEFILQYEQPDPNNHLFTNAITTVMNNNTDLFLHLMKSYKINQETIDELYKHLMFCYDTLDEIIMETVLKHFPTTGLIREVHINDGLYEDISEGIDILLNKCKKAGYILHKDYQNDTSRNTVFKLTCANGNLKVVKDMLNKHRRPKKM